MEVRRSGNFGFVDPGNGSLYSFDISGRGKGWEPSSIMLNHNRRHNKNCIFQAMR